MSYNYLLQEPFNQVRKHYDKEHHDLGLRSHKCEGYQD